MIKELKENQGHLTFSWDGKFSRQLVSASSLDGLADKLLEHPELIDWAKQWTKSDIIASLKKS